MRTLTTLILSTLCCAGVASAQFESAAVVGTVKDSAAAVVQGCKLKLTNIATGISVTTATDETGDYQFFDVRTGTYRLSAEKPGFQTSVTAPFSVSVNSRQRVDLNLLVGEITQSVEVSEAAALIESDTSDRGQVIGREEVVHLPLNGRSYADLALLAPGVRKSQMMVTGQRDSSYNVNGQRAALNNFILDGVDNNNYGLANPGLSNQAIQLSPDAVQEFKVQTDNYSAEFGRTAGAVINATIRSGTNQFHASAWDYLRNTSLNAVGFFKPLGGSKPVLIQNQFGGAAGGPIRKDKVFFFADYEGLRKTTGQLVYATIPTLDQRNGVFDVPVANPYTGQIYPDGVVPSSQITAYARKVLGDLPIPNRPGTANNYEWLPKGATRDDKGDARLDYYLSSKINVFGRFSERSASIFTPPTVPGASGGASVTERVYDRQVTLGSTWTINAASVLEARLGLTRTEGSRSPAGKGSPTALEAYGITGLPNDTNLVGGLYPQTISGYTKMGQDNSSPQRQFPDLVNPKVNYSRTAGRHTLKAGYEYQAIATEEEDFHPKYGTDTYAGQFTRPVGVKSNSIYNVADFLFGARDSYQLNNIAVAHYLQKMHFAYFQDDFKVSPKLTLNLGVRYEFATPQYERDNKLSNYDPVSKTLIQASNGSLYNRALVKPDYRDWAPRVGFAYTVAPHTVIRSSYGISYIHFNREGGDNLLAYNGPFVVLSSISQLPSQGLCSPDSPPQSCFRPTQLGYPQNFASPANFSTALSKVNAEPADTRAGYVQSWHFTIQRELPLSLMLDIGYVGNHSVGLLDLGDLNQARPQLPGQSLTLSQRRPIAGFDYIEMNYNAGFASYDGLQAKLEKRYASGLYLLNSFTWSKAIDNAPGHMEQFNGDQKGVDIYNIKASKGVSSYDQPLNDTFTIVYELPTGRGRKFLSHGPALLDAIGGGWRLTAINTMVSSQPINLRYNPSSLATVSALPSYRPNVTGDAMEPAGQRNIHHYLNPDMVQIPDVTQPFGNAGRNTARSNALFQLDIGAHKEFRLPVEGAQLQFRAELFNAMNRTNFMAADGNRSNSTFGTITTAFPARQVQLALKLMF
jgi:hypothetical protein